MKDIYLDRIQMKNCRGHYEMEMDFPIDNFTVIQGKNGAGKSTIPKAISMALFGDDGAPSGHKITITDMVNRKKKKNLEIEMNFRIIEGEVIDQYKVQLYYAHSRHQNRLFIKKNGVDISGETKTHSYKILEGLLYPKDVYHNVIYFRQQVKNFFTSLTNTEQKMIFDSILQTKVYSDYYSNVITAEKVIESDLIEIEKSIVSLERESKFTVISLDRLKKEKADFAATRLENILDVKARKVQLENQIQVVGDEISTVSFSEEVLVSLNTQCIRLQQQIEQLSKTMDSEVTQLDSQRDTEFVVIESGIQKTEQTAREGVRVAADTAKSTLMLERSSTYDQIEAISKKYNSDATSKDCNEFVAEKQKEHQAVSFDINQLDSEFSTSKLEFERDQRLEIIERNIQELRDKAAELKSTATKTKESILSKEHSISHDEESLIGETPICTKCLRPFGDKENTDAIKDGIDEAKLELEVLLHNQSDLQTSMVALKSEYEDAVAVKAKAKFDYDENINAIISDKTKRQVSLQGKQTLLNQEIEVYQKQTEEKINEMRIKMDAETSELRLQKSKIDGRIMELAADLKSELDQISAVSAEDTQNRKLEHNKRYDTLREELKIQLNEDCDLKKTELVSLESQKSESLRKQSQVKMLDDQRRTFVYKLQTAEGELKGLEEDTYIELPLTVAQSDFEKATILLQESITAQNIQLRKMELLKFWKIGFSDTGIKSMLIDMAIPHMNEAVSKALEILAPGIFTVSFDTLSETKAGDIRDKFAVNVLHNIKGTDSHKLLSGGEQRIVDLACMEALRSLTERLYGKRIHNLFYDEVLDSLDEDNRQMFCQVSKLISSDKNVTLITHNTAEDMEPDRIFKL